MKEHTPPPVASIAVIGVSCQLPSGVDDPNALWDFCSKAQCSARPYPESRFKSAHYYHPATHKQGHFNVRAGSFLDRDVSTFDAAFFNITATEAVSMDPQQRLLLECAFTALENAGLDLNELSGRSDIGVFAGGSKSDYDSLINLDQFTATHYAATGNAMTMFANRISYFFNWRGPSITIDTACSSSLGALHAAVQSLRHGECSTALVGGSFLQLSPMLLSHMAAIGAVSPDGISFSFDSRANGYGRGEGAGCLILRSTNDAIRARNTIRANIRNTGINHCGRSQGITVPKQEAQIELIRNVYASAGLDPTETAFVECHGTGTSKGDPIEAKSIASAFKSSSLEASDPLYIGSVKSNFGHLEGGSGILSVLKAIVMLERGMILPNANFETPNPDIDFETLRLKVPTTVTPWPSHKATRVSINNFGFGGSNAHAILERHTRADIASNKQHGQADCNRLYVVSAKCKIALQANVAALQDYVTNVKPSSESDFMRDLSTTLCNYRTTFKHSHAIVAPNRQQLIENLGLTLPASGALIEPTIFVFTGQGAQWAQMGISLMSNETYSATILDADKYLRSLGAPWSLVEEIAKPEQDSRINEAALSQPATTALQIALVILLEKHNICPARVCGHSSGEIAAAFAAGYLDFRSCLAIAYYRGVAATELASANSSFPEGAMMAVGADVTTIQPLLNSLTSGVATIACYNSPRSLTLSGDAPAVLELKQHLDKLCIFNRLLRVRTAYHSDHMGLVVARYLENLTKTITPSTTSERKCTFHSSVTTSVMQASVVSSPTYWAMNLVCPVQFSHTLRQVLATSQAKDSGLVVVEIGPHAALRGPIREICTDYSSKNGTPPATYVPALQRAQNGHDDVLQLFASLVNLGHPVNTRNVRLDNTSDSIGKMLTDLPTYRFNLDAKYWHSSRLQTAKLQGGSPWNSILGHRVDEALGDTLQFRHVFTLDDIPWLVDHQVEGSVVFPMAGYISAVVEALHHHKPMEESSNSIILREVVIDKAFLVSADNNNELLTVLRPQRADTRSAASSQSFDFELLSWTERTGFVEHCRGFAKVVVSEDANLIGGSTARQLESRRAHQLQGSMRSSCFRTVLPSKLYEAASRRGLSYGPSFQGVTSMQTGSLGAYGTLELVNTELTSPSHAPGLLVHPAWLDAALHVGLCNLGGNEGNPDQITAHVPTFLEEMKIQISSASNLSGQSDVFVHNIETSAAASSTQADITIFHSGQAVPALQIQGLRMFQTSDASGMNDTIEADAINPSTVDWLPYPEFSASLVTAATKVGDEELEHSLRQNLERLSLNYMIDAMAETSQRPQSLHIGKLYDWLQRETNPNSSSGEHSRRMEWLACSKEERALFGEDFAAKWPDAWHWVHVGKKLPMILREEVGSLEVLMEDNLLYDIYETSSIFHRSFRQLAELVDLLSRRNPWLRILEIGAGTGGCTSRVLEKITAPSTRFETYDYTDISSGFFEAARTKFRTTGGKLNFLKLDICADVEQQGFQLGYYDLVIAADVIHATPDLDLSLTNIRKLLKPTGSLALVELSSCTPSMFPFATLPGWWYRGNEDGAFVPEQEWQDLLVNSGFNGIEASLKDHPQEHLHSIIWSRPKHAHVDSLLPLTILDDSHTATEFSSTFANHCSNVLGIADITFGRLTDTKRESGPIICLHELNRTLLAHPTEEEFAALQRLFETATGVLWVVDGDESRSQVEQSLFDFAFGFARSIRREYAGTKFVVLKLHDIDPETRMSSISTVYKHCFIDNAGDSNIDMDYRVRDGIVEFPRLAPHQHMTEISLERAGNVKTEVRAFSDRKRPLQLQMAHAGSLETMLFEQPADFVTDERPLGPRELLIEIKGTGLNFKDILIALGSLPWQGLGRECCGVVVEVGRDIASQFQIGDTVLHWGTGLFASHARCHVDTVAKAPADLGFGEAAAVPVVFGTVYECLINVARLEPGESILIHAAAGGVGQAAIMLARHLGAEVYCTVGTPEKKTLLMDVYGIPEDRIFSSRSPSFADTLLLATGGKGVDVVLNSLSDEMFQSTWKCVSMFGRFIDIGKKHFVSNSRLELNPFDNSITYSSVDLSLLIEHRGPYVQKLMSRVVDLFNKGVLKPPAPVHLIAASDIQSAFRSMQSGKVIGKIVIVNDAATLVTAKVQPTPAARIRSEGSYIITGGTGGLGRALARWLIELGARYIVLVSRSGGDQSPDSELSTLIAWASENNAKVFVAACDVSEPTKVETLLKILAENDFPSPSGVIHGAMVLEDSLFEKATPANWASVIRPKVQGALSLHHALSGHSLDFFVCLSSIVSVTGNIGQSSYAGSNAVLDSFCQHRRRQNLPAISINLPAIAEIGYVAEAMASGQGQSMERYYAAAITQSQLLSVIECALATPPSAPHGEKISAGNVVVGLAALPERASVYENSGPLLNLLYREIETNTLGGADLSSSEQKGGSTAGGLKRSLAGADMDDAASKEILYTGIKEKISSILMVAAEDIRPDACLEDLGLDSLIAVELRNWLVRELGVSISVIDIADSASVGDLSDKVAMRMR